MSGDEVLLQALRDMARAEGLTISKGQLDRYLAGTVIPLVKLDRPLALISRDGTTRYVAHYEVLARVHFEPST